MAQEGLRTAEFRQPVASEDEPPGTVPREDKPFYACRIASSLPKGIGGVVLVKKLREVQVVAARVFLDVRGKAPSVARIDEYVGARIAESFTRWWTFGAPWPDVYYEPQTVDPAEPFSSLHAKCVVVDDEVAFVGSANFTERAYERNIEVGVLVRDRGFAERLAAQWANLVEAGLVRRYVIG